MNTHLEERINQFINIKIFTIVLVEARVQSWKSGGGGGTRAEFCSYNMLTLKDDIKKKF